ncbi:alanine/ornithine racemase family PLP-dependent enzyme [Bacillus sp. 2205SS5-2]|uniref:alanine/ornithine racemase family PLP-dependent enzyme n=1 Tax=Bacillus sp. 2205SS5-2 TaxID=3109031 RepID=UPI00300450B7
MYPLLKVNLSKIKHNAAFILARCEDRRMDVYLVTKGISADLQIIQSFIDSGYTLFADSRIQNIAEMKNKYPDAEYMMLRIPGKSEVESIVDLCDISLNSEWETILSLDKVAEKRGKKHRIILMIELGDLREGVSPDSVLEMVKKINRLKAIKLEGVGANFGCFGGVLPSETSFLLLTDIARNIERVFGRSLQVISGGNSSALPLIFERKSIGRINQLRIGESIYLGVSTVDGNAIKGLYQDAFQLQAEIVEIQVKSSVPRGTQGTDAFGDKKIFPDIGWRLRAILSLGKQDVDFNDIHPINPCIKKLGGSSDHLIVDITEAKPMDVGDKISFNLSYGGLLRSMSSAYIAKHYTNDVLLERRLAT